MYELGEAKCPKNLFKLVENYLHDGKILVVKKSVTIAAECSRGCPRESNSGPLLWIIICSTALRLNLGENVHLQAYADDYLL